MFTSNLTTEQFHAMRQLIDVGVKAVGLGAVTPETLALRQMIETAQPVEPATVTPAKVNAGYEVLARFDADITDAKPVEEISVMLTELYLAMLNAKEPAI